MKVTHSTVNNGNISYTTVKITVTNCVITDISTPTIPSVSAASYIVFDVKKTLVLAPKFLQVPACGYTINEKITWTIPTSSPITKTTDPYTLTMVSTNGLAHHAVNTVIVQNFVTYQSQSWSPMITFPITITDPCRTSTITPYTFDDMTVVLGKVELQNFSEAIDSAGTSYGATVCGPRLY